MLSKVFVVSALAAASLAAPEKVQKRQTASTAFEDSGEFDIGPVGEAL